MIPTTKLCALGVAMVLTVSACNTDGDDGTTPVGSGQAAGEDGVTTPAQTGDSVDGTSSTPTDAEAGVSTTSNTLQSTGDTVAPFDGSVCVVLDGNGLADDPQNRSVVLGAQRAATQFGVTAEVVESPTAADAAANFDAFVADGCSLIVASSVRLADAARIAATTHADQQFAIVDYDYPQRIDNMMELTFDTTETSFLAGYLAAATSDTGVVAAYAGINIETFTVAIDSFASGVAFYNREAGAAVTVLGTDGSDLRFAGSLDDLDVGADIAAEFAAEGADTIFPVAGNVGLGTAQYALGAAPTDDIRVIGIDHDGFETNPDLGAVYLTSVVKNFDVAVLEAVERSLFLGEVGGQFVGTLENGALDLAPFHERSGLVSTELREQLDELRVEVIAGNVSTR